VRLQTAQRVTRVLKQWHGRAISGTQLSDTILISTSYQRARSPGTFRGEPVDRHAEQPYLNRKRGRVT
jgi:hypothetical protein